MATIKTVKGGITAPKGFLAAGIHAGIKPPPLPDLALVTSTHAGVMAGVFTRNRLASAPVVLGRRQLGARRGQAMLVNSGNANAMTGTRGMADAAAIRKFAAAQLRLPVHAVFVGSTGIIGRPLPVAAIRRAVAPLIRGLRRSAHTQAARAIMSTDTIHKETARQTAIGGRVITIGGMAKGSGMICPDLATMLAYLTTDASIDPHALQAALTHAVNETFNCLCIDGDTSPNDTVLCLANGQAGNPKIRKDTPHWNKFSVLLCDICLSLSQKICRDGEGVTKVVEMIVRGAKTNRDAWKIAHTAAASLLVKTAFFGEDPNWGRLLAAAGRAGVPVNLAGLSIHLNTTPVVHKGRGLGPRADRHARRIMRNKAYTVTLSVGNRSGRARIWTTDLSREYVTINASYTT